jgi:mannosyl-3-phosphoglycerate phosphatase
MINALIFTDLDGTLLDDRYDLVGAAAAMDRAYDLGAVVVPVSSKTQVEMAQLRQTQRIPTPFIFENGAGIDWGGALNWGLQTFDFPDGVEVHAMPYPELCKQLQTLRQEYNFQFVGFNDLAAQQIAALTELSISGAEQAKQRAASEPIVWNDTAANRKIFSQKLQQLGLSLQQGGRFYTVTSARQKHDAVSTVLAAFSNDLPRQCRVVVCGDSPNDLSMLQMADVALLFNVPKSVNGGDLAELDRNNTYENMKRFLQVDSDRRKLIEITGHGHEVWIASVANELSDIPLNS